MECCPTDLTPNFYRTALGLAPPYGLDSRVRGNPPCHYQEASTMTRQTNRWPAGLLAALAILLASTIASASVRTAGSPLIVNVTDDSDDGACNAAHCSLREAIGAANARAGSDRILFDATAFPPQAAGVIELTAQLPSLQDDYTTIDAVGAGVTIDGSRLENQDAHGLFIVSSGNTIRGLRLQNIPGIGVLIGAFDGNSVHDNTVDRVAVVDSGYGSPDLGGRADGMWIMAYCADCRAFRNRIVNSTVENGADDGIELWSEGGGLVDDNVVTGNSLIGCAEVGVEVDVHGAAGSASRNIVANNRIIGADIENNGGIIVNAHGGGTVDGNLIYGNSVADCRDWGIALLVWDPGSSAGANRVANNTVEHIDDCAITVNATSGASGVDNRVYRNSIIENDCQARNGAGSTHWDHNGVGNYWSDYSGVDADGDGIGDTPYTIPSDGVDHYPLMAPYRYPHRLHLPLALND